MNFFKDISKEGSYLISIVLLFTFYLCPATCYAECKISNKVQTITEENLLTSEVLTWNQESLLNKYCYFEIGKKYLKLFEADKSQSTLNKAILYLEYASKQLTIRDSEYTECLNILLETFFYTKPLDCDKLIKYKKRNKGINIAQNDSMRKKFQNAVQPTLEKYINDPFNSVYPEQFIVKVNIIMQMYNIKIDIDIDSVKIIHQLVNDYNLQLENITRTHSIQQFKTINPLLDRLSNMGVQKIPKSNAVRALQQYHQLYEKSLQPANRSQACELLNSALNHLNTARNTFPFLTNSLNINCHKPLACLLGEINIQSLMLAAQNVDQYDNNLGACEEYKARYNTAKNTCPNVTPIFDFPTALEDLITFYKAYNTLSDSIDAFVNFMRINNNIQLTNAIQSNESVKNKVKISAQNVINNYINDPFHIEYPAQLATNIQLFSQYNIPINANNLPTIHQLVGTYNRQLNSLNTNQSAQNVNSIIASLDRFSGMGIQNVPKANAVRALQQYHQLYTQSLQPAIRSQSCELLNSALNHLNTAKNTFPFLTDSLNINCHKPLACLFGKIKIQSLMPDIKNENQYANQLKTCEQYQTDYNNAKTQCPNLQTSFQLPTQLDDLIKFYNAHNFLISDKQQNIHPTDLLSNFMNNIQNNQKPYAKKLYNLAGFYMANYYYQKSYKLLSEGPGQNRDETLRQIKIINDKLNKDFIKMGVDVFNQYSKILEFLNFYQDKPVSETKTILSEIDQNIRQAWGLDALLTAEIEKRKQEELAIQKKMQQESLEKKKQHEALEKKKQQEALEKKNQQKVLEKKKQQEAFERKRQREKFERNKQQDHLHIKEMKKDYNKKRLDEPLRKFNQIDSGNFIKSVPDTGISLSRFEKFAIIFQQSYETLTCDYIQNYFPNTKDVDNRDCLYRVISQSKISWDRESPDSNYRFYFAFASIRKAQNDYENWIENLCIAYDAIPINEHQATIMRNKVMKELALAKMYMNNTALSTNNTRNLRNVGLLTEWKKNNFIQEYIDIDVFSNYNEAKNAFENIDCTVKYEKKTPKLQQLLYTFRMETNNEIRREYIALLAQFIDSCINIKEKKFWTDLFFL